MNQAFLSAQSMCLQRKKVAYVKMTLCHKQEKTITNPVMAKSIMWIFYKHEKQNQFIQNRNQAIHIKRTNIDIGCLQLNEVEVQESSNNTSDTWFWLFWTIGISEQNLFNRSH